MKNTIDYEQFKVISKITPFDITCIYLFVIDNTKTSTLVLSNDYVENSFVCKFGYTKNLTKRFYQHTKTYGDQIVLKYYSFIDPSLTSDAEMYIKQYMGLNNKILDHDKFDELVILSENELDNSINDLYSNIGLKFSGHNDHLIGNIHSLNNKIIKLTYELKIKDLELQLANSNHKYELLANSIKNNT